MTAIDLTEEMIVSDHSCQYRVRDARRQYNRSGERAEAYYAEKMLARIGEKLVEW
jgi:hypothetical protein